MFSRGQAAGPAGRICCGVQPRPVTLALVKYKLDLYPTIRSQDASTAGKIEHVPVLIPPALPHGTLSQLPQPSIPVGASAVLRPWLRSDAAALEAAFQDAAVQRWHPLRADSTDEARGWIDQWHADWSEETNGHWALVDRNTETLLGRLALKSIEHHDGSAGLGYWMVAASRGLGLCPVAVSALCIWAFHVGFHRIEAEHSTVNQSSCRVLEKAGFHAEGLKRRSALHADGWHDMHTHALLAQSAMSEIPTR